MREDPEKAGLILRRYGRGVWVSFMMVETGSDSRKPPPVPVHDRAQG